MLATDRGRHDDDQQVGRSSAAVAHCHTYGRRAPAEEKSFSRLPSPYVTHPMDGPTETNPPADAPPVTTGPLARLAAARLRESASRQAQSALAALVELSMRLVALASRRRVLAVGVCVGVVGSAGIAAGVVWRRAAGSIAPLPDVARSDPVSFLVSARERGAAGASASEWVHYAGAAVALGEHGEALEALERALQRDATLVKSSEFLQLALQSFRAGKSGRSQALLAKSTLEVATPALQQATVDLAFRVRHGAADTLRQLGIPVRDPTAMLLLDLWQLERCDQRRAVAHKLLSARPRDVRVAPGLAAAARRPTDDGCLRELVPRTRAP